MPKPRGASRGAPTSVMLPSRPQQIDVSVDVVLSGDSVENEVETAGMLLHLVRIPRDDDLVGSEAKRVFLLVGRSREDNNVGAERMGKLHAHVAESAESDHANFLALGDTPVAHGRVGCDSGAEQRSGSGEVEVRGDAKNKPLVDDDAIGVAAVGDASKVLVRRSCR